jgi:Sulfotransferase domain
MLPTFLIIGAPKAGSTSLFRYVTAHPEVFGPSKKELDFFVSRTPHRPGPGGNWSRGVGWYEEFFAGGANVPARGEASPKYSMHPHFPDAPSRIASVVPDARLVYVVRNPIRRMVSHYVHRSRYGHETRSLESALSDSTSEYVMGSRYAYQLEQYREYFPPNQLHVVIMERMADNPAQVLARVFAFLGVDSQWTGSGWKTAHNVTTHGPPRPLTRVAMGTRWWKSLAGVTPTPVKEWGRGLTHRAKVSGDLPVDVRVLAESFVRNDVAALAQYVEKDFDGWGLLQHDCQPQRRSGSKVQT